MFDSRAPPIDLYVVNINIPHVRCFVDNCAFCFRLLPFFWNDNGHSLCGIVVFKSCCLCYGYLVDSGIFWLKSGVPRFARLNQARFYVAVSKMSHIIQTSFEFGGLLIGR